MWSAIDGRCVMGIRQRWSADLEATRGRFRFGFSLNRQPVPTDHLCLSLSLSVSRCFSLSMFLSLYLWLSIRKTELAAVSGGRRQPAPFFPAGPAAALRWGLLFPAKGFESSGGRIWIRADRWGDFRVFSVLDFDVLCDLPVGVIVDPPSGLEQRKGEGSATARWRSRTTQEASLSRCSPAPSSVSASF